jgi:hypothetical protein
MKWFKANEYKFLKNVFLKNTYQILIKGNLWMDRVKIIEQNLGGR